MATNKGRARLSLRLEHALLPVCHLSHIHPEAATPHPVFVRAILGVRIVHPRAFKSQPYLSSGGGHSKEA